METLTINLADLTDQQKEILFQSVLGNKPVAPSPSVLVEEFHKTYNQPIRHTPTLDVPETDMRLALIEEEAEELRDALNDGDLIEVADALADLVYVTYGAALTWGIPLDKLLAEVQASNLSKLGADGLPIFREDGKVLKGPNFFVPNVAQVLADHILELEEAEGAGYVELASVWEEEGLGRRLA